MIERPSLMDRRCLHDNRLHSALYWLLIAGETMDAGTRKHLTQNALREAKLGQIQCVVKHSKRRISIWIR